MPSKPISADQRWFLQLVADSNDSGFSLYALNVKRPYEGPGRNLTMNAVRGLERRGLIVERRASFFDVTTAGRNLLVALQLEQIAEGNQEG